MAEKKLKNKVEQVVEKKRFDNLPEAIDYLKSCSETNKRKFVETFDLAINSNIDTKTNQTVRGSATLPAGTGKDIKVVVFTDDEKLQKEALAAGAIMAGLEDLITKINDGFLGFDYCIATPDAMKSLSKAAKKLGPRGLMPIPKNENITNDVKKAVEEARKGKVNFKNDKSGIIHAGVGKVNFSTEDLKSNIMAVLNAVKYLKPEGLKGKYLKSMFLSTTMGPSVEVSVDNL
jgi:large subunit ribosomal protein L1